MVIWFARRPCWPVPSHLRARPMPAAAQSRPMAVAVTPIKLAAGAPHLQPTLPSLLCSLAQKPLLAFPPSQCRSKASHGCLPGVPRQQQGRLFPHGAALWSCPRSDDSSPTQCPATTSSPAQEAAPFFSAGTGEISPWIHGASPRRDLARLRARLLVTAPLTMDAPWLLHCFLPLPRGEFPLHLPMALLPPCWSSGAHSPLSARPAQRPPPPLARRPLSAPPAAGASMAMATPLDGQPFYRSRRPCICLRRNSPSAAGA
jgi:hypothetical protein